MKVEEILWHFIKNNKTWVSFRCLLTLFNFPMEAIVVSKLSGKIYRELSLINSKNIGNVKNLIINLVLVYLFIEIFMGTQDFYESKIWTKLNSFIREHLYDKIMEKSEINYESAKIGEITMRLGKTPWLIETYFDKILTFMIPFAVTLVSINAFIWWNNPKIGLITTICSVLYVAVFILIKNIPQQLKFERERWDAILNEKTSDKITNSINIYTNDQVNEEREKIKKLNRIFGNAEKKYMISRTKMKIIVGFFTLLLFSSLLFSILYFGMKGEITKEQIITLVTIALFLIKYLRMMGRRITELLTIQGSFKESNEYLKELDIMTMKNGDKKDFIKNGEIMVKNLNFRYEGKDELILDNINIIFKPKNDYVIIGHSGSGKTTLMKLILGFYQNSEGNLQIDGVEMKDINRKYLRQHISYINQTTTLFDQSILYNIQYGTKKSKKYIKKQLKKMDVMNIFRELNDGLKTSVGKNGDKLSGGQRQVLLMLRNYFRDSKVLILDEPTSAIDRHYKKYVMQIIEELKKTRTIIIITHDESIMNNFTHKIRMEKGKIVNNS